MHTRGFILASLAVVVAASAAGVVGYHWTVDHVRRWTGRPNLGFTSCDHCHGNSLESLPWSKPRPHHSAPAGIAVSPDGKKLYAALDDRNELVEADAVTRAELRRVTLPGAPFGVASDTSGKRLYVSLREQDRVVALDAATLKEVGSVPVGLYPVNLAYADTKNGGRLVVANSGSDTISVLSTDPFKEIARPAGGREPYAVAISPDGVYAYIANRLATAETFLSVPHAETTILDLTHMKVAARARLESAHLSEGVAAVPGQPWMLTPLIKVRNLVPITQVANGWVMSSGLALADHAGKVIQVPLDEAQDYFADPSGIAVDREGKRAYVVSGGSDTVSVVDIAKLAAWLSRADDATKREAVEDLSLSAEYVVARIPTGRNPRQITLSPDGRRLFVAERLEDRILVVDTATLKPTGHIVLGDGGRNDPIRRGEQAFTKAAHTFQRQFSCRSCHPDGHVDGLSYDFDGDGIGDNLLDNRSLQGVAKTGPFKWIGKNPSLQIQCGPRFARVLMRTDPIPPKDLDDLATFIESQPPPRTNYRKGTPLTPSQERGRRIFFATTTTAGKPIPRERQCQTCHRPPLFTNRLLSDIATKAPTDSTTMFDTPHLLGVSATAPYLHDGRAKTLEELWTTYQTNDMHGVSSYMSKHQLNDLIEYLKTL